MPNTAPEVFTGLCFKGTLLPIGDSYTASIRFKANSPPSLRQSLK